MNANLQNLIYGTSNFDSGQYTKNITFYYLMLFCPYVKIMNWAE